MDPEIAAVRRLLGEKPRPVGWAERRRRLDEVGTVSPPAADVVVTPADLGGVPVEWSLAPGSDPETVLVYFHGGGFCSGSIASHRRLVTEAGRAAGGRGLAVGYRLAPEHPYPAAVEDAETVWRALLRDGVRSERVAVAGDSAGGGLAVALIARLRAAGAPGPACAWLLSPWTDLTMSGATLATKDAADPLIHKPYLQELAAAYLPAGLDPADPRVSVLNADLTGFPPLLIQVGAAETLLSDAVRFAEAAGTADVPVRLEIWPEMIHAFPLWNAQLAAGRRAIARAGAFVRESLEGRRSASS
jgi:acetyl esterase/lipase